MPASQEVGAEDRHAGQHPRVVLCLLEFRLEAETATAEGVMRFHSQNLNEKRGGRVGSMLRNGRAWLHLGRYTLGWQWCILWSRSCHAYVAVRPDGESTIGWSVAVPGFALYAHLDTPYRGSWLDDLTRRKGSKYGTDRCIGLAFHDEAIWWDVWADEMEWRPREDPRWRHGSLHVLDVIFGRAKYSTREIEKAEVVIPMPEGSYPATAVLFESTWKRPRWPFARRLIRITVNIPNGIPHAGKGENSWDCGDDATFGVTCSADSIADGIGKVVAGALRDRGRYGLASTTPRAPVLAAGARV